MTWQEVAGLKREGWELELGLSLAAEPRSDRIDPACSARQQSRQSLRRTSGSFRRTSVRWDWRKYDAGVRVGLTHGLDVTFEYATHDAFNAAGRVPIDMSEVLATVRWRM